MPNTGRRSAAAIVICALIAYGNALGGQFHFDDAHAILENPAIRSLSHFGQFFTDAGAFSVLPQNQGYRPLLLVTYALTAAISGVNARAFIAVSLLIHVLCALLVYATVREALRQLGREANSQPIAFLTGLIFAVHPLFSECVNYVSARSESLSGALALAALYAYLRARTSPRWILVSMAAIAGALLTKPVATIFPLILIVFEAAAAKRDSLRRIALRFFPVTAVVLALGLLGARMTPAFAIRSASNFTRTEYLRSELPAIWHYVRLFLLPMGQSGDPAYPTASSFFEPRVVIAGLALLLAIGFAIWGIARRRYVGLAVAIAWFILCIFPASSIFPLAEIVNEHRPYLAAVSLCALAAAGLMEGLPLALRLEASQAREASLWISAILLLGLGTATVLRNRVWRSELTLWADVVAKSPESTRAQMNLGLALMSSGRVAEAEPHLREAVRLAPYYAYAQINLGNLLLYQNLVPEALGHLDQAMALDPNLFWAPYYRGLAAEHLGDAPHTRVKYFALATALSPSFADAWYHLALARDAGGDLPGSFEATRKTIALRAGWDERFMLAYLLLKQGDANGAKPLLVELQKERPDDTRIKFDLEYAAKLGAK